MNFQLVTKLTSVDPKDKMLRASITWKRVPLGIKIILPNHPQNHVLLYGITSFELSDEIICSDCSYHTRNLSMRALLSRRLKAYHNQTSISSTNHRGSEHLGHAQEIIPYVILN